MSKPRPGDQPLLIIFVIGGVSSTEVRQVRDVVAAAKTNIQVTWCCAMLLLSFLCRKLGRRTT